ncbi:hypothetical protein JYU04_03475 [Dehalococcoides mccartyi]|nr:hypothetical protein [Dehalococcoides mccartyi]
MTPISFDSVYLPLLHGAGGSYDELIIFGGIGVLLVGLAVLSYRASKGKDERRKKRKAKRRR